MLTPEELGQVVARRRLELGRKQVDVVRKATEAMGPGAISEPTYRSIERGRTEATERTLAAASIGLDWPATALADIRDGRPVEEAVGGEPVTPMNADEVLVLLRRVAAQVERLADVLLDEDADVS